jgi:hypothetical protein
MRTLKDIFMEGIEIKKEKMKEIKQKQMQEKNY